jgi:hypothetical protein
MSSKRFENEQARVYFIAVGVKGEGVVLDEND